MRRAFLRVAGVGAAGVVAAACAPAATPSGGRPSPAPATAKRELWQCYFAGQEATYAKQQETQAMLAKLLG